MKKNSNGSQNLVTVLLVLCNSEGKCFILVSFECLNFHMFYNKKRPQLTVQFQPPVGLNYKMFTKSTVPLNPVMRKPTIFI